MVRRGALARVLEAGIGRGEALFAGAITGWAVFALTGRPLLVVRPPRAVPTDARLAGVI